MSRRSSSRLTAGLEIEYINHLSTKSLGKVPTTFGEFLEDIGPDTLKKFPIMDQIGGTCVIFSIATAISIAKGKMELHQHNVNEGEMVQKLESLVRNRKIKALISRTY